MAISVAKALGAKKVYAVSTSEGKLDIAKTMGADLVINSKSLDCSLLEYVMKLTNGDGVPRIAECSGNNDVITSCFKMLRKGGKMVLVGLPKQPVVISEPLQDLVFKSLTLRGIHGRLIFHTWEEAEKLVYQKKINLEPVISHRF